jgi:hypothetical protein
MVPQAFQPMCLIAALFQDINSAQLSPYSKVDLL